MKSEKVFGGYTDAGSPLGEGRVHCCAYWDRPIWQRKGDHEEFAIIGIRPNGSDLILVNMSDLWHVEECSMFDMRRAEEEGIFS